jgi:DNA-binding CsgD family transcriptional regulator
MTTTPTVRLRPHQQQTLLLLAAGLTTKQAATRLGCTPKAVYHRVAGLKRAFGVTSRFDVLLVAGQLGLISDADVDAVLNPPPPRPPLTPKPHALPDDARRIADWLTARMETP